MKKLTSLLGSVILTSAMLVTPLSYAPAAVAGDVPHDRVVSDDPANWTPHALDKAVKAIEQVGDTVVAGGELHSHRHE